MGSGKQSRLVLIGTIAVVCVVVLWLTALLVVLLPPERCLFRIPLDVAARGQLGDAMNTFTSLISAVTLALLVIGVLYQHEQLMDATGKSRDQLNALKEDRERADRQSIEDSLFRLLSFHNDVVNSMHHTEEDLIWDGTGAKAQYHTTGRECFRRFYERLGDFYKGRQSDMAPNEQQGVARAWDELYDEYGEHLGHYFRRLYNIVRFVDERKLLTDTQKYEYVRMVRAQLCNFEVLLLLYNSMSPRGTDFGPYIRQYKLLKGMDAGLLLSEAHWHMAEELFGRFWE